MPKKTHISPYNSLGYLASDCYSSLYMFFIIVTYTICDIYVYFVALENDLSIQEPSCPMSIILNPSPPPPLHPIPLWLPTLEMYPFLQPMLLNPVGESAWSENVLHTHRRAPAEPCGARPSNTVGSDQGNPCYEGYHNMENRCTRSHISI